MYRAKEEKKGRLQLATVKRTKKKSEWETKEMKKVKKIIKMIKEISTVEGNKKRNW